MQITDVFLRARADAMPWLPRLHTDEDTGRWIEATVLADDAVWVAEEDGDVLAFLAMAGHRVEHLYVRPDRQRRGLGSRLLQIARSARPDRLELHVFQRNLPARAFYEAHGFTAADFDDGSGNEEREPDARYVWRGGHGQARESRR